MRLFTVGSLPPEWGGTMRGGAATVHAALLTELSRRDEVEIVGVLPPEPIGREVPVPVWPRPADVSRARHYKELLERLRPDAVLMNHFAHTVGATHARLGSPVPAVGVAQSWHNVTFASGERAASARELTQEALGGLDAVVAVSRHCIEEGRGLGLAYPPLAETIHNPVPPLYMHDVGTSERARDGVLFLGSLIPRKRPEALLGAAPLLPGVPIALVGNGELADDLGARIAALGLQERVRLTAPPPGDGHLPWVRDALLGAEAMCLPSRSEGLPLVFVEALACGTPILGFGPAVREIREELGIAVGEPLDDGSPEEIAAAIELVRGAKWDRDELRRATLRHFGLDRVTDRYVELLGRVVAGRADARVSGRRGAAAPVGPRGTAICVLGPSRAGTSLTTRVLSLAGVHLGPEGELLSDDLRHLVAEGDDVLAKAADSNPGGHFEHYRLMRLNERILRTMGGSWRDPPPLPSGWEGAPELDELREETRAILAESFGGHALWGWKDPRNSLTLPFWRALLPQMRCVICLRHPLEVAGSLRRRDGIELAAGVDQWTRYLAAALVNSAGLPRLLVRYEDYFHNPGPVAAKLAHFAGREGAFGSPGGREALDFVIDEGLWRHRVAEGDQRPGALSGDAGSLLRVAELLALADPAGEGAAELNAAADRFAEGVLGRIARVRPPALAS